MLSKNPEVTKITETKKRIKNKFVRQNIIFFPMNYLTTTHIYLVSLKNRLQNR